jgi:hypothetical protein
MGVANVAARTAGLAKQRSPMMLLLVVLLH